MGLERAGGRAVEAFVARVRSLTDEDRRTIAEARRAVDEAFHQSALLAGAEALAGRGEEYARARRLLARAHVPERLGVLGEGALVGEERAYWDDVARLVQLGIDDALIAILASDRLHPNHVRELHRSFKAVSEF